MNDHCMIEAYLKTRDHDEEDAIFNAFCDESKALKPGKHVVNENGEDHCVITCGFKDRHHCQMVIGKIEKLFPGKIDWR